MNDIQEVIFEIKQNKIGSYDIFFDGNCIARNVSEEDAELIRYLAKNESDKNDTIAAQAAEIERLKEAAREYLESDWRDHKDGRWVISRAKLAELLEQESA